jgi:hypothetical protein
MGERQVESRFAAAHGQQLTPLIGREEELELLSRRWRRAADGEGQVVLLSGEPGIGKSRLTRALQDTLTDTPHLRVLLQCSPHHTSSTLYPVISQLELTAGFFAGDSAAVRLDKLADTLAPAGQPADEIMPLFASLLSIPAEDRYPLPRLTPQQQKDRTLAALIQQLEGLSLQQPVLFILEDAHWIDPTTQELIELTIPIGAQPADAARPGAHGAGAVGRCPAGGGPDADCRAQRRYSAVRRGADPRGQRGRCRRHHSGNPA